MFTRPSSLQRKYLASSIQPLGFDTFKFIFNRFIKANNFNLYQFLNFVFFRLKRLYLIYLNFNRIIKIVLVVKLLLFRIIKPILLL